MGKFKDILTQPIFKTESSRAGIQIVAGGYVVYLAYDMLRDLAGGESTEPTAAAYVAAIALGLCGIGVLIYAIRNFIVFYKAEQAQAARQAIEEAEAEE